MLGRIGGGLNQFIFGRLLHRYEPFETTCGPARARNSFDLRSRKGTMKLYHDRVWRDAHDVRGASHDYSARDVHALIEVFTGAIDDIAAGRSTDYGVVLRAGDGAMRQQERFYTEASGDGYYLFCRSASGAWGAEHTEVTSFAADEVERIAQVLLDARERMGGAAGDSVAR
ncbi:MAG: hypothetical protein ACF8R7_02610 [Phycisphaerales bacterium JB039]